MVAVLVLLSCSPLPEGSTGGRGGSHATGGAAGTGGAGGGTVASGGGQQAGGGTGAGVQGGGAGGGSSVGRSDELTAGTRLKVRAVVGADGSRQQIGFFDTARMENCAFLAATDNTQRCLPLDGAIYGGVMFADSQCTQPLFYGAPGCSQPKYGYRYGSVTCGATFEFHSLSTALNPIPTVGYTMSGPNCQMVTPGAGYVYYRSAGVIPPTSFVQGNFVVEP